MISYTLKHLHQDIKQHLFCGRVLTNWNPHYFCALTEYIAADMAILNNLCNHGNSRSFAVCFNDFMLTDARGRRKFDQQRFLQLCRTKFGSEADGLLKSMQLTDPAQKFRSFRKGKNGTGGRQKLPRGTGYARFAHVQNRTETRRESQQSRPLYRRIYRKMVQLRF